MLNNVLQAPPTVAVYNPDGSWHEPCRGRQLRASHNPVLQSLIEDKKFSRNRVLSTVFAEVEPVNTCGSAPTWAWT